MSQTDDATQKKELYNRQEYVIGAATQARYGCTHVLVVGAASGLSAELVKNLVLTGVGRVDILDDSPPQWDDLGTNFFARPGDVINPSQSRAAVMAAAAQQLNRFVEVRVVHGMQSPEQLRQHMAAVHVVVFVNARTVNLTAENAWARERGIRFVSCESRGVAGCVFVDAGDTHDVLDSNGEETVSCVVTALTGGGVVTLLEGKSHECEVGSEVYFTGLAGAPEMNSGAMRNGGCSGGMPGREDSSSDEDGDRDTSTDPTIDDCSATSPSSLSSAAEEQDTHGSAAPTLRLFTVREVISPHVLVLDGFPAALSSTETCTTCSCNHTNSNNNTNNSIATTNNNNSDSNSKSKRDAYSIRSTAHSIGAGEGASAVATAAPCIGVDELISVGSSAYMHTTKRRTQIHFDDLATSVTTPSFMDIFDSPDKMDAPALLHAIFRAVGQVRASSSSSVIVNGTTTDCRTDLPRAALTEREVAEVVRIAHSLYAGEAAEMDVATATSIVRVFHGDLNPMACLIGGMAAQEVLKVCSGKFTPVQQWMYYDAREVLRMRDLVHGVGGSAARGGVEESEEHVTLAAVQECHTTSLGMERGVGTNETPRRRCAAAAAAADAQEPDTGSGVSRFAGQIAVFGQPFQSFLRDRRCFIVGAGALGCEHIKNVALMGLGAVSITDMDAIEMSNLSRQFLFRHHHIGSAKSTVAAAAARDIAPGMRITAYERKVDPESEGVFHESFWSQHDVVLNALDNVLSRKYVDGRCLFYKVPLFESGTLGAKCNMQPVIPYVTESYSSSFDPPEKSVPLCTLKNFPHAIEHTIQWGRDLFHSLFVARVADVNRYLDDAGQFALELRKDPAAAPEILRHVYTALTQWPQSCADCVRLARLLYEQHMRHVLCQLLHNFPRDKRGEDGSLFWVGAKKPPTPPCFDVHCRRDRQFVFHTAALLAQSYGLARRWPLSMSDTAALAAAVVVPAFVPSGTATTHLEPEPAAAAAVSRSSPTSKEKDEPVGKGRRVDGAVRVAHVSSTSSQTDSNLKDGGTELSVVNGSGADVCGMEALPSPAHFGARRMHALEFEKDDLTNHHVQFVTYASNIRAAAYGIPPATVHQTRRIAGNIIPAMVTTTALVTGLVGFEVLKYLLWQFYHSTTSNTAVAGSSSSSSSTNHNKNNNPTDNTGADSRGGQCTNANGKCSVRATLPAFVPTPDQLPRLLTLYRSAFVNVALPFLAFSDPIVAEGHVYTLPSGGRVRWGVWDRLDVNEGADVTVERLVGVLSARYELEIFMITLLSGKMVYSYFGGSAKDRVKRVSEVAWQKGEEQQEGNDYLNLVVSGVIGEEEDVDIPVVRYKYRNF